MTTSLYSPDGHRKYLTQEERLALLNAVKKSPRTIRTFVSTLVLTGCRISEGLALTVDRVDLSNHSLIFKSLKKREKIAYRPVPVPAWFIDDLDMVHGIREAQQRPGGGKGVRLWTWSRTTAWRRVKEVMVEAKLGEGIHATAKGMRHGFGVAAISNGVPLNMAQKWFGHAQITTTAIYADAIGKEERAIAERMWQNPKNP